jgi:hypothetical protein
MMSTRRLAPAGAGLRLAGLALALVAAACSSATVNTDFDKSANFGRYKTYSYRPGDPAQNQLIDRHIQSAIDQQLQAKHITKADSGAGDLVATYHVALGKELEVTNFGYAGYGPYWSAGPSSSTVREVPVGTLIVDLLDSAGTHLVWRGQASDAVSSNADKVRELIDQVVARMFQNFPPKG